MYITAKEPYGYNGPDQEYFGSSNRSLSKKGNIRVSEIFGPTIQGEGPLIGRPTVFVRTGGCDYRCDWCDTLYAVLPKHRGEWALMPSDEILARVEHLAGPEPLLVTISGGNPALQPLEPLITSGHRKGYTFALETQGSVSQPWFAILDWLILSPKPPSSGMPTDWQALEDCITAAMSGPQRVIKVVVFDDADYAYARLVASRYPSIPVYLQVGNPGPLTPHAEPDGREADVENLMRRFRWLVEKVAADRWFVATVLPQLHVLAWGNKRGV